MLLVSKGELSVRKLFKTNRGKNKKVKIAGGSFSAVQVLDQLKETGDNVYKMVKILGDVDKDIVDGVVVLLMLERNRK